MERGFRQLFSLGKVVQLALVIPLFFQIILPGRSAGAADNGLLFLPFVVPPTTMCLETNAAFLLMVSDLNTGLPLANADVKVTSRNLKDSGKTDPGGNVRFKYVAKNSGKDEIEISAEYAGHTPTKLTYTVEVTRCAWDIKIFYIGRYKVAGTESFPVNEIGLGRLHVELSEDETTLKGSGYIGMYAFSYVKTDQVYCPMFEMSTDATLEIDRGVLNDNGKLVLSLKYPTPTIHTGGGGKCIVLGKVVASMAFPDVGVKYDPFKMLLGSPIYYPAGGGSPTPVDFSEGVLAYSLPGKGRMIVSITLIKK